MLPRNNAKAVIKVARLHYWQKDGETVMKLGDIKAEALRLMFVNFSFNLSGNDICKLASDETYGSYIVNMNGSINRCLDVMERSGALTASSVRVPSYENYSSAEAIALENGELAISDQASRLIPLYVKSELYAEDEPRAAQEARNLFDFELRALVASLEKKQASVTQIYTVGE